MMMKTRLVLKCIALALAFICLSIWGCPFYLLLRIPCPGCGTTRAWLALLRGDFCGAFAYNHFFLLMPAAIFLFVCLSYLPPRWKKPLTSVLVVFAVVIFLYNLLRWFGFVVIP